MTGPAYDPAQGVHPALLEFGLGHADRMMSLLAAASKAGLSVVIIAGHDESGHLGVMASNLDVEEAGELVRTAAKAIDHKIDPRGRIVDLDAGAS